MPQVQFDRIDDEDVAMCISKGWYLMPNVIWLDPAERDLSNHSTVEVLEEQMNGFHRVLSVLKYPVKLDEKHVCCITETDVNNQPFRIIHKYPRVELLDHMVTIFNLLRNCQDVFQSSCSIYTPTNEGSNFSASLPGVVTVFYFSHLDTCVVLSHCVFFTFF